MKRSEHSLAAALILLTMAPALGQNTFPATGNVGIGITPSYPLDVYGPANAFKGRFSGPDGYITIGPANSSWAHIYTDRPNFIFNQGIYSATGVFSSYSTTDMALQTSGTTRLTISNSTGRVGIGIATPELATHLLGTLGFPANSGTNQVGILRLQANGSDGVLDFSVNGGNGVALQMTNRTNLSLSYPILLNPNGGNIGVGTTTPQTKLHITGDLTFDSGTNPRIYTGVGSSELNRFLLLLNSPSLSSASGLKAGGVLVSDSYSFADPGKNDLIVKGNVGIGTAAPDAKLAVSGLVHATEVKVSIAVPGPDYVFDKNYKLMSLTEIKNYIDHHQHLPDVPSASEMEKNGIQLGEMNMLLLKKVEELTLYVIELKEENEVLLKRNKDIDELKIQIELLNKRIK